MWLPCDNKITQFCFPFCLPWVVSFCFFCEHKTPTIESQKDRINIKWLSRGKKKLFYLYLFIYFVIYRVILYMGEKPLKNSSFFCFQFSLGTWAVWHTAVRQRSCVWWVIYLAWVIVMVRIFCLMPRVETAYMWTSTASSKRLVNSLSKGNPTFFEIASILTRRPFGTS